MLPRKLEKHVQIIYNDALYKYFQPFWLLRLMPMEQKRAYQIKRAYGIKLKDTWKHRLQMRTLRRLVGSQRWHISGRLELPVQIQNVRRYWLNPVCVLFTSYQHPHNQLTFALCSMQPVCLLIKSWVVFLCSLLAIVDWLPHALSTVDLLPHASS